MGRNILFITTDRRRDDVAHRDDLVADLYDSLPAERHHLDVEAPA